MGITYQSNKICPQCKTGGYVWYLDNSEYVAKCTNCGHYFRKEDFPMCVLDETPKPITNVDRIRAMTVEGLAEFFAELPCCPPGDLAELCYPNDSCEGTGLQVKCWLDWLRQEAKT